MRHINPYQIDKHACKERNLIQVISPSDCNESRNTIIKRRGGQYNQLNFAKQNILLVNIGGHTKVNTFHIFKNVQYVNCTPKC